MKFPFSLLCDTYHTDLGKLYNYLPNMHLDMPCTCSWERVLLCIICIYAVKVAISGEKGKEKESLTYFAYIPTEMT